MFDFVSTPQLQDLWPPSGCWIATIGRNNLTINVFRCWRTQENSQSHNAVWRPELGVALNSFNPLVHLLGLPHVTIHIS